MFDQRCYDLAEYFLDEDDTRDLSDTDVQRRIESLAQAIQDAVEAWMESEDQPASEGAS